MEADKILKTDNLNKIALRAGMWYVISNIILRAISVISTPIFTRLMSTESFGVVATFNSWCSLLLVFCTLNLTYSIGRAKLDYPDKLDNYIGSMQLLSLLAAGIIGLFLLVFIKPISGLLELPPIGVLLLVVYLLTTPSILFFQNGCRYRYRYKENILIAWIIAIGSVMTSLLLFFCLDGDRAVYRMIGSVAPSVVLAIYIWRKSIKGNCIIYNKNYWVYGMRLSVPLILHDISLNILSQSDRIFIIKLCGASETGIYSIASNYGLLMSTVTNAIAQGWLPWFHDKFSSKEYDEIKRNVKWIVLLGCYIGLACIALAPEAMAILGGENYAEGIFCVAPITLGVIGQYIYTHYVNIEMHLKQTKFVPIGTSIAAVINLILNAIFIPLFGYVAAAYTTLVSYLILMLIHYAYTRFVLQVKLYNDKFMFGTITITGVAAEILVVSYSFTVLRYILLVIGFMTFLFVFRKFIIGYVKKIKKNKIIS